MFRATMSLAAVVLFATACRGQEQRDIVYTNTDIRDGNRLISASWNGSAHALVGPDAQRRIDDKTVPNAPDATSGNDTQLVNANVTMPASSVSASGTTPYGGGITATANAGGNALANYTGQSFGIDGVALNAIAYANGQTTLTVTGYPMYTQASSTPQLLGSGTANLVISKGFLAPASQFVSIARLTVGGSRSITQWFFYGSVSPDPTSDVAAGACTASMRMVYDATFVGRNPITLVPFSFPAPWCVLHMTGRHRNGINGTLGNSSNESSSDINFVKPAAGWSVQVEFVAIADLKEMFKGANGKPNHKVAVAAGADATQGWAYSLPMFLNSGATTATANSKAAVQVVACDTDRPYTTNIDGEDPFVTGIPFIY